MKTLGRAKVEQVQSSENERPQRDPPAGGVLEAADGIECRYWGGGEKTVTALRT